MSTYKLDCRVDMPYDNTFRQLWKDCGYPTDLGSCATGRPPDRERLRLFHLSSTEHAVSNIVRSRLKVARFSDLNDPFELMALNFQYGQVRRLVREFRTGFDATTGLLCFSEDWTSPVMWSHYAARHRGICLGFDVLRSSIEKVQYEEKRLLPELGESDEPFGLTDELRTMLRHTKCHEWAYEREWRTFVPLANAMQDGELYFRAFGDDIHLSEVIVGADCERKVEEVRQITAQYHPEARVYKARLAFKHFKVVPHESTVP